MEKMRISHACPQCGREFTRKWNLKRHIGSAHPSASEARMTQALFERADTADKVLRPKPSPPSVRRYGIEGLIRDRLDVFIAEKASMIVSTLSTSTDPLSYEGYVCEDCLNVDLLDIFRTQPLHECNELWLLDHPEVAKNSDVVLRFLRRRLSWAVAEVVRKASLNRKTTLVAFGFDKTLESMIRSVGDTCNDVVEAGLGQQGDYLVESEKAWLYPIERGT